MKNTLLLFIILLSNVCFCQEERSKIEELTSSKGVFLKFIDTPMGTFLSGDAFLSVEYKLRVREIVLKGLPSKFFFQVIKPDKTNDWVGSVEYEDLKEVRSSLDNLKIEFSNDKKRFSDKYIENSFKTQDNFIIGYYIDGRKTKWFFSFYQYGSLKSLFFYDSIIIEEHLDQALKIIETEVKK